MQKLNRFGGGWRFCWFLPDRPELDVSRLRTQVERNAMKWKLRAHSKESKNVAGVMAPLQSV
jgi:hypothetical protein